MAPPATHNESQKTWGWGKIRMLGEAKFKFVQFDSHENNYNNVATRCHILRLKCTKRPPQTPMGELTALLRPPNCFRGVLLLHVRKRKGEGNGRERKGVKIKKEGRERRQGKGCVMHGFCGMDALRVLSGIGPCDTLFRRC